MKGFAEAQYRWDNMEPPEFYDDIEEVESDYDGTYDPDYPDELTNEEYDQREDAYISWMERGSRGSYEM